MKDTILGILAAVMLGIGLCGIAQCSKEEAIQEGLTRRACIDKGLDQFCNPIKKNE